MPAPPNERYESTQTGRSYESQLQRRRSFTYNVRWQRAVAGCEYGEHVVNAVNDPPTATDDVYTGTEDTVLGQPASTGLLQNDDDLDGDALS